jgi:hypothetical protein
MKYSVTIQDLNQIPLPEKTSSYTPVAHGDLIQTIEQNLSNNFPHLSIVSRDYMLNNTGQQFVGKLNIQDASNPNTELNMSLGFRNSYDKSMAVGLASGAQVLVCSNGMLSGEMSLLRKHTSNVWSDIDSLVFQCLNRLESNFEQIKDDMQKMKEHVISKQDLHRITGELFMDKQLITAQQMGIIRKEIKFSDHFSMVNPKDMTLWNLYNNVTESLKVEHPSSILNKHLNLHNYTKAILLDAPKKQNKVQFIY